jgi:acyl-lipid omega-6 desaturase (Delta-12 desaturase)
MWADQHRSILKRHPRQLERRRAWEHLFIDCLLWATALVIIYSGLPAVFSIVAAAVLYASFVFRAFGMMHECVHCLAHRERWVNDAMGEIYGIFCFLPFSAWRRLHLDHHKWTGNVERDPSMKILLNFEHNGFTVSKIVATSWRRWIPLLGFMQHVVFWKGTKSRKEYLFLIGSLAYLGGITYLLGPTTVALGILIYLYLVEIVNFPHHLEMVQWGGAAKFPLHEQYQFTRSCVYPRWLAHYVFLNFNLHTEHHLFPGHPWYQLDALHRELSAIGARFNRSKGNAWILRNRRRPVDEVFAKTFQRDIDSR